jgi:hypothetical protein
LARGAERWCRQSCRDAAFVRARQRHVYMFKWAARHDTDTAKHNTIRNDTARHERRVVSCRAGTPCQFLDPCTCRAGTVARQTHRVVLAHMHEKKMRGAISDLNQVQRYRDKEIHHKNESTSSSKKRQWFICSFSACPPCGHAPRRWRTAPARTSSRAPKLRRHHSGDGAAHCKHRPVAPHGGRERGRD